MHIGSNDYGGNDDGVMMMVVMVIMEVITMVLMVLRL